MAALLIGTITEPEESWRGRVAICGSHGGRIAAALASAAGLRAVILHDAGIGLHGAGVAGIRALDAVGMAAAAVHYGLARIGDAEDMAARGRLSTVNRTAAALGLAPGMPAAEAAAILERTAPAPEGALAPRPEARRETRIGAEAVILVDSVSLLRRGDRGRIAVTGSHGGAIAGDPGKALPDGLRLVAFNDAGIGADAAGTGRLRPLESRGVAALCVSHASARIGEADSTLGGLITGANFHARRLGFEPGGRLRAGLEALG